MVDGVIIMLVGLGVVFLFLVLLIGFIRVSGIELKPKGAALEEVQETSESSQADDSELAAAIAVAIVMSSTAPARPVPLPPTRRKTDAWRRAGRLDLHSPTKMTR